jgi:hypothetical protein
MTWREKAKPIIAAVLAENAGKSDSEIRAALLEAYPFGSRSHHPYKVWCSEVRRQRGLEEIPQWGGHLRKPRDPDPRQSALFFSDILREEQKR